MSNPKKTILIVDDSSEAIDFMGNILKEKYDIKIALNGNNALKILNSVNIDLILLDIVMPGLDGYEVCKKIKANSRTQEIPIIFLTGRGGIADKMKGIEIGATDYITKPVDTEFLIEVIKKHLD